MSACRAIASQQLQRPSGWACVLIGFLFQMGCTSGAGTPAASGGAPSSGGSVAANGGTVAAGGATNARGGTTSAPSGGAPNAAGGTTQGGTAPGGAANGGASASGGTTGNAQGGGQTTRGGSTSSGGSSAQGGSAQAGGTGMAGGMGDVPAVVSAGVRWVGRVDISNSAEPRFSWSGSGFVATVNGDTISVKLRSDGDAQPIFFQPVIDNMLKPRVSVAVGDGVKTVTLGTGLGATDHKVELYRETEGKPGFATSTFLGFASGTLKDPPNYSGRLIEIVGDSISAGYGSLGEEDHPPNNQPQTKKCGFTTETEGAFVTYGAVAARAAGADASILAGSGWGIYSDNQGNMQNVMPNLHARTLGASATPAWSFNAKPQVVVINLGTNDFSANMDLASQPFSNAYNAFLTTVRGKYPDAVIFCAVGSMLYSTGLTNATSYIKAIVAARNTAGDMKVKFLDLGSQDSSKGTGCDWHPNATEQKRMADILSKELKAAVGW